MSDPEQVIRDGKQAALELRQTEAVRIELRSALMERMVSTDIKDDLQRARLALSVQLLDQVCGALQSKVDSAKIEEAAQEAAAQLQG